MKKFQKSYSEALMMLRKKHPQAYPNYGFVSQLQKYEKAIGIKGNKTQKYSKKVIPYNVPSLYITPYSKIGLASYKYKYY